MKKNKKMLWEAVATFVGTVIGAGILGIPYVIAKAGLLTGLSIIAALGIICAVIYLYLGEIVLRTKGTHQLTGYAEKYLGKPGKILMTFSMIVGIYGALIAYLIGEGKAIASLFGLSGYTVFTIFGFNFTSEMVFSLCFFCIVSIILKEGLNAVGESELFILPITMVTIVIISIVALFFVKPENLTGFNINNLLMPYGVILFAFLGATAVPEMQQELVKNRKMLKKAILIGIAFPLVIYCLFAVAVVGVTGLQTTEVATIGLGESIGEFMLIFGNVFAIFNLATSFLALGLALYQMYMYDYKMKKQISWLLTCVPPLIIALSGITSFIGIIGLGGVIAGGIDSVLIILMAHKAKKMGDRKPEYTMPVHWLLSGLIMFLFFGGAAYYLWTLL